MRSLQLVLFVVLVAGCCIQLGCSSPVAKKRFTRVDKEFSAENSLGSDESELIPDQSQSTDSKYEKSEEDDVSQPERISSKTQGGVTGVSSSPVGDVVDSETSSEHHLIAVGKKQSQSGVPVVSSDVHQPMGESVHEHDGNHLTTSSENVGNNADSHESIDSLIDQTSNLKNLGAKNEVYTENSSLRKPFDPSLEQAEHNTYPQMTDSSEEDDDTDPAKVEQKIRLMHDRINDIVKRLLIKRFIERHFLAPNRSRGHIYLGRYYFPNPISEGNFHDSSESYWRTSFPAPGMSGLPYRHSLVSNSYRYLPRYARHSMDLPEGYGY